MERLLNRYHYPRERLRFEHLVNFGREKKRADIVILDKDRVDTPYIIVEVKKPKLQDGKAQLRSYCNATGAPIAVWTNGQQISHYHRRDPNYFEDITDIPNADQTLADILNERFTLKDLILKDKLATEHKSLKDVILELEDEVLANAGVDVFEEVFKLIFTKLYDEFKSQEDKMFINRLLRHKINTVIKLTFLRLQAPLFGEKLIFQHRGPPSNIRYCSSLAACVPSWRLSEVESKCRHLLVLNASSTSSGDLYRDALC